MERKKNMRNSVSAEFRVKSGILCRGGNSVLRGEFRVEGGIPCRGRNSVSREEFRVEGGIPCREGNFYPINICVFLFFQKCFSGLANFRDLQSLAISGPSFLEN
jgi:hypothetical protein